MSELIRLFRSIPLKYRVWLIWVIFPICCLILISPYYQTTSYRNSDVTSIVQLTKIPIKITATFIPTSTNSIDYYVKRYGGDAETYARILSLSHCYEVISNIMSLSLTDNSSYGTITTESMESLGIQRVYMDKVSKMQCSIDDNMTTIQKRVREMMFNDSLYRYVNELEKVHVALNYYSENKKSLDNSEWKRDLRLSMSILSLETDELLKINLNDTKYHLLSLRLDALNYETVIFNQYLTEGIDKKSDVKIDDAMKHLTNIDNNIQSIRNAINYILTPTVIPSATSTNIPVKIIPLFTSTPIPYQIVPTKINFDYNHDGKVTCKDFSTREQVMEAYSNGYTELDGNDHDGIPCESVH